MSTNIGNAYMSVVPQMSKTGMGQIDKDMAAAGKSGGGKFASAFGKIALAAGALYAVKGIKNAINSTAEMGDAIDKNAQKLGISNKAYQQYDYVLARNGASINALKAGMKTLTAQMESGSEAFDRLGVSVKNQDGSFRSTEAVMDDSIMALASMTDATERAALANDIFGKRTAQELTPMLNSGSASIKELKENAIALGAVMSDDAVKNSAAFEDAMEDMNRAATGVRNNLMGSVLPMFTQMATGMSGALGDMSLALYKSGGDWNKIGNAISTGIQGVVSSILEQAPKIIQTLLSALTGVISGIAAAIPTVIPDVIVAIIDCVPQIVEAGVQLLAALINAIPIAITKIVPKLPKIITSIVNTLTKSMPIIITAGVQLLTAIVKNLPAIISGVVKAIPEIISALVTGITSSVSALASAGVDLVRGLWEGIKNTANWLWERIKGWFSGILQKIKNFLGIHSPSKVFAEIGGYMAEGIGVGFEDAMPDVTADMNGALGGLTTDVSANVTGSRGGFGGIVIQTLNVNAEDVLTADRFVDMLRGARLQYA